MWPAGRVTEWKITEQEPRHAAEFDDVLGAAHHDRRDAIRLKMPRDQTHGLMTHGSVGGDDGRIDIHPAHMRQDVHAILLDRGFLAAIRRRADELFRQPANPPLGR